MNINSIVTVDLFNTYKSVDIRLNEIKNKSVSLDEKRILMSKLKEDFDVKIKTYIKSLADYSKDFITRYELDDYEIIPNIGSPTPYGYQLKPYLWSGLSILPEKSFSFQYSWVFQKDLLEITFSFGSGKFSSSKVDEEKKTRSLSLLDELTKKYINILEKQSNRNIISKLLKDNFVFTLSWLEDEESETNKIIRDIDEYIEHLKTHGGAKSGLTLYINSEEIIQGRINLDEKLNYYFELFYPIWSQLHNKTEKLDEEDEFRGIVEKDDNMEQLNVEDTIEHIKNFISNKGFSFPESLIENFYLSLRTKPFVILAGISGTGKTKLVNLFAEALGANKDNKRFRLIPVRPEWNDPSDLLGYKDLSGQFNPGVLTQILVDASLPENKNKPYFICLDEMNLARVEHYFSDVLSLLETTEWKNDEIITNEIINVSSLSIEDQNKYGKLYIPENVYIIGTVNMDETTYPFSKKVLDRANTIEFNYIDLTNYPNNSSDQKNITSISVKNDLLKSQYIKLSDMYEENKELVHETTEKLVTINKILEPIHANIGFRTRDAICFYMAYNSEFDMLSSNIAFDYQMLQKILPRIQGSSHTTREVLISMLLFTVPARSGDKNKLINGEVEVTKWLDENKNNVQYPKTAEKLLYMLRRLDEDGFTSYWIS